MHFALTPGGFQTDTASVDIFFIQVQHHQTATVVFYLMHNLPSVANADFDFEILG
jgi:phage FluMu gp28-like protein